MITSFVLRGVDDNILGRCPDLETSFGSLSNYEEVIDFVHNSKNKNKNW